MCGICGVYEFGTAEPGVTENLVVAMRDTMVHRGPDDAGVYVTANRRVGFGGRRLAIVDLSPAGRSPMSNEDRSVWITFNGEIYNHEELRPDLIRKGHVYRTRTDTETIIHLYEEQGVDFVDLIEGDFAIAIWDDNLNRLVLARDRIGVKPLYYTIAAGRLIFGSEIKAILAHPAVSRDVDEEALYHYLTFLTTPAPQTLFAGIRKLPAGCLLTCDSNGNVDVRRYWDAIGPGLQGNPTENEIAGEVLKLLTDAVKKRMMSDVPFGVFLSGGVDSSANVALMAGMMDQPVRTFTVGFRDDPDCNELEEARRVAREFGTDHHEVVIGQDELIEFLPELIFHQDEPIADPVCVPLYYVAKLARDSGTTVVQVGEGSDELFCGYDDYRYYLELHNRVWRRLMKMPRLMRRGVKSIGMAMYEVGGARLLPKGRKMLPDLLRRLVSGEDLFWSGAFVYDEYNKKRLLSREAKSRVDAAHGGYFSSYEVVRADVDRLLSARPDASQLDRMIYQDLKLRLPELLLMRVDKLTMATSIEARVPFLDHRLVELAMSIPQELKYRNGTTKYILKRALRGVVPDYVLERRKKGFGTPINSWLLDRLGRFFEHSLFSSSLRKRGLFDYGYIERILRDHRAGRANYAFFLWCLLNLSLWYDQWIEGRPSSAFDDTTSAVSSIAN